MTEAPQHFPPPGAPLPPEPSPGAPAAQPPHGHVPPGHVPPGQVPPGHVPPGHVPPGHVPPGQVPPGAWAPYQGHAAAPHPRASMMLGAAHKPGAFALRPLTLGNIYDGAFRIIRFNPKATVGAAVLVTAIAMLIPVVITAALTFTVGLTLDTTGDIDTAEDTAEVLGLLAAYGSLLLAMLLTQIGVILVTGMIAHVTRAAAVGRRLDLGEAWAATHGKRWRLFGLMLVINLAFLLLTTVYVVAWIVVVAFLPVWAIVIWGLVSVPGFLVLCAWLWIRFYYLPVPPLMLEDVGVFGALARGWKLTSRQYWRTFGIALLTILIGSMAGGLLTAPISIGGQIGTLASPEYAALILIVTQALALVVQNAFVAPFVAAVTSVQYIDLRMRKEGFDVALMREAGVGGA